MLFLIIYLFFFLNLAKVLNRPVLSFLLLPYTYHHPFSHSQNHFLYKFIIFNHVCSFYLYSIFPFQNRSNPCFSSLLLPIFFFFLTNAHYPLTLFFLFLPCSSNLPLFHYHGHPLYFILFTHVYYFYFTLFFIVLSYIFTILQAFGLSCYLSRRKKGTYIK